MHAHDQSFSIDKSPPTCQTSGKQCRFFEVKEIEVDCELGAADARKEREYKVLRFEFEDVKDATGKRIQIDLTPSSKETVKLMNNLVKEGFEVRELFKSKNLSVLLERSR